MFRVPPNRFPSLLSSSAIISALLLSGCIGRAYTKPRSSLVSEASDTSTPLRSAEEDSRLFVEHEEQSISRLKTLVASRLEGFSEDRSYRIGASDQIEVHVFEVPELNFTAAVTEGGFLPVPLIGAVPALGMTPEELTVQLTDRLKEYIRSPKVTLAVVGYSSQKVALLGAVKNPGVYPLKKGTSSLLELVGEAGGLSPRAGNYIEILPVEASGMKSSSDVMARARLGLESSNNAKQAGIEVMLDDVLGARGSVPIEVPLRGGDTVIVPESGAVVVEGEVMRVGSYELGQRMTLLGALAAAGGITYGADVHEVEIVRTIPEHGKASLVLNLEDVARGTSADLKLRGGDIVRVPTDTERRLSQDTFEGITRVLNFGVGGHLNLGQ